MTVCAEWEECCDVDGGGVPDRFGEFFVKSVWSVVVFVNIITSGIFPKLCWHFRGCQSRTGVVKNCAVGSLSKGVLLWGVRDCCVMCYVFAVIECPEIMREIFFGVVTGDMAYSVSEEWVYGR